MRLASSHLISFHVSLHVAVVPPFMCVYSCVGGAPLRSYAGVVWSLSRAPGLFDPNAIKRDVGHNWALKQINLKKVRLFDIPFFFSRV